jgi:hypothetical protein
VRNRIPQKPEVSELSVALIIQPEGSVPVEGQTFAVSVDPTARK